MNHEQWIEELNELIEKHKWDKTHLSDFDHAVLNTFIRKIVTEAYEQGALDREEKVAYMYDRNYEEKRKKELEEIVSGVESLGEYKQTHLASSENDQNERIGYNDALSDAISIIKSKINPPTHV